MRCAGCPLFTSWNNESDKGEACGLFGDGWDFGLARCLKHDLVTDFLSHKKFETLECVEEEEDV